MSPASALRWRPGDGVRELLELATTTYPGQELTRESYLDWQYARNPHGPVVLYYGALNGQALAQYLVIPRSYRIGLRTIKGSLSVNTLTAPDHRGTGWFIRLAEATYTDCAKEGIAFTVGFPNPNSHAGFVNRLGFESLGSLEFLARPLRWYGLFRRLVRRDAARKGEEIALKIPEPCLFRSGAYCIEDWEPGPLSEQFFASFHAGNRAASERSDAYLQWRYRDCPTRHYRLLRITDPGRQRMYGFVVLRALELSGLRCGVVVDYACTPDTLPALVELVRFSVERFRISGLDAVVTAAVPETEEGALFRTAGFYRVPSRILPQPLQVILRVHDPAVDSEIPRDLRSWFLTFGDYDVL